MRIPLELPPGLNGDDTTFAAAGRWADGSNVRFWRGRAEVIRGWELLTTTALTGICRSVFGWTDNAFELNLAFGTNSKLQLWLGGEMFDITPSSGFTAGAVDGTGGAGYGTGAYSTGEYSEPSTSDFFPLTWSLAAWGENLLACPRDQTIFTWENATGTPAAALSNAPDNVAHMLVAPQRQVFALGCNEEVSGGPNPLCLRHSSVGDNNEWDTAPDTTAREYILPGGGRIVAGRVIGDNLLVWTSSALFLGTFIGSLTQPWRFDKVGDQCGLIGPGAAIVVGQRVFWIGPDLQFYAYGLGGAPYTLDCPIRNGFANNLAASQGDKIVATSISAFNEVRWDYPDARDGTENSRYLAAHVPTLVNNAELAWYRGTMARTAFCDAPPSNAAYPVGVDPSGNVYWHEKGQSADGSAFAWFIETADNYLDPERNMMVRAIWPDVKEQVGPVMVQVASRFSPQGDEVVTQGSTMAPGARKSDVRATGLLARVRFYGNSAPTAARLGSPIFEVTPTGAR